MKKPGNFKAKFRRELYTGIVLVLALQFILVIVAQESHAQGNLLINPRRVVFEGNKRSQDLNLANTGKDTAKYNVSIIEYRMKEDGSFQEITMPDDGQNFADKYIRFFPRTVTLAPNEAQIVKMQLYRTDQLKPGEYRSHVYFRAVPKQTALGTTEKLKDSTAIGIKLVPVFGITIPVIIRSGESTMKVNLSDLKLDIINDSIPRLQFTFNRSGNMSVYGDLRVEHISDLGISKQVGIVKGIAVYTPNSIRRFQMDLENKNMAEYHKGKLKITFSAQTEPRPEKYTEAELKLQ